MEVISLISRDLDKTKEGRRKYGIGHVTTDLADSLALKELDAVILHAHADARRADDRLPQRGQAMQVEIPLCDVLKEGEAVVELQKKTGLVAMCGHTSLQPGAISGCTKDRAGEFNIQQMDVQTYFFRRTNMNALGQPRAGRTTCCGITLRTPWICSPISAPAHRAGQCRAGADSSGAGHRDGYVDSS